MVIYPAEVAAELSMTGQNKNGSVVTRARLREAIYRNCTGLSRRQADEILEATFVEICDALARGETVKGTDKLTGFHAAVSNGGVGSNIQAN